MTYIPELSPVLLRNVPQLGDLPEGITIGTAGGGLHRPVLRLKTPLYAPYATGPDGLEESVLGRSVLALPDSVKHVCVLFPPSPDECRIVVCPCSPYGWLWGRLTEQDQAIVNAEVRERMNDLLDVEQRRAK